VRVAFWGTRGSLAAPGPETVRYGGNTSCLEVEGDEGTLLVLDAGTGIRRLGARLAAAPRRIDILLTHLHMDHVQGLPFFAPLRMRDFEIHVWGPASPTMDLRARLGRYLAPPLFPVLIRDLASRLTLHEVPAAAFDVGEFRVTCAHVCHPGPTVGYRIEGARATVAYIPDHEPALGARAFPSEPAWTSGYGLAEGADLLVHDAQYAADEYAGRAGWGHSTLDDALAFAGLAGARHLATFHHDPGRDDDSLEALTSAAIARARPSFRVTPAAEGLGITL
jgi:phosphoribosyl 1,2-cyclic phosphodiesterase